MKKIITLIAVMLITFSTSAHTIDYINAKRIATNFLSAAKHIKTNVTDISSTNETKNRFVTQTSDMPTFYIFNAEDNKGFVIISGEDAINPILGYSDESTFSIDGTLPPALEGYLHFLNEYITNIREGKIIPLYQSTRPTASTTIVEPLCKSLWGQNKPYNNLCPNNVPTGCVATAMSQIMYYWQWPDTGVGKVSYMAYSGKIKVDFSESVYDWKNMKNSGNSSALSAAAVAKLNYDCGVSVKMQYDPEGSGSYAEYAFKSLFTNFKYSSSKIKINYRECVANDEKRNTYVKNELDAGRPILYTAQDANGQGGHAFIIDGYDSDFNVHVNWGWDGSHNGFFALTNLPIQNLFEFSISQTMVRCIEPDYTGIDNKKKQLYVYMQSPITVNTIEIATTDSFTVTAHNFYNLTTSGILNVMVGLCNLNGEIVAELCKIENNEDFYIDYGTGYSQYNFDLILPSDITDGDYVIKLFFQERGFSDWMLPAVEKTPENNMIFIRVENGKVMFNKRPVGIESITIDRNMNNAGIYNLAGQKLLHLQKGLNIINGKKILVK